MHIAVIGTGYVGLVTGACFADFGMRVTCVDKDQEKIRSIRAGQLPIYEPELDALVSKNVRAGRLDFSTDVKETVGQSLVVFLAVGTPPSGDGSADMSQIDEVAYEIAKSLNGFANQKDHRGESDDPDSVLGRGESRVPARGGSDQRLPAPGQGCDRVPG
jgi:UDPglucose 6-dehydrogenase